MTMTRKHELHWYKTNQNVHADVWAFTNGTNYVGFKVEPPYEKIDKYNLVEVGFGTMDVFRKEVQHD